MIPETPRHQPVQEEESVLRELNRRRVVRVLVAYVAVCFGLLSAGHVLFAHVGGPDWGFRALLGAAALGFPLAAVLAWVYDVTPQGIVRTPEDPFAEEPEDPAPEWAWAVTVAGGVILGLASMVAEALILT